MERIKQALDKAKAERTASDAAHMHAVAGSFTLSDGDGPRIAETSIHYAQTKGAALGPK